MVGLLVLNIESILTQRFLPIIVEIYMESQDSLPDTALKRHFFIKSIEMILP